MIPELVLVLIPIAQVLFNASVGNFVVLVFWLFLLGICKVLSAEVAFRCA